MKKLILLLCTVSLISYTAYSQIVVTRDASGMTTTTNLAAVEKDLLDKAYLECFYDMKRMGDTVAVDGKMRDDIMVLQIGNKYSKFYSYRTFISDSLIAKATNMDEIRNILMANRPEENYNLFKDYSKKKLIYTDKIAADHYRYEEDLEPQDWKIFEDTKEIQGYLCQLAKCNFRGRSYQAWFTPEIPVSEGPWKFNGLPGLILAVADDAGHYSFELSGIRRVENTDIDMPKRRFIPVSRKDLLTTMMKFHRDPAGFLNSSSGGNVTVKVVNPDGTPRTDIPVRTVNYDFMERDYR